MDPLYLAYEYTTHLSPLSSVSLSQTPNLSLPPGPVPSLPNSHGSPPPENSQCQVCQNPFYEENMLLYVILLPPSLPSQLECGNAPYVTPLLPYARLPWDTSASPPRSLTLILVRLERGGGKAPLF